MIAHGLLGGRHVTPRDSGDDASVIFVRALRSARRIQRFLSTLSKEVHHRVGDAGDGFVVSGPSDGRVKIGILGEPGAARGNLGQSGAGHTVSIGQGITIDGSGVIGLAGTGGSLAG